jgi:hypothetical protein
LPPLATTPVTVNTPPFQGAEVRVICEPFTVPVNATSILVVNGQVSKTGDTKKSAETWLPLAITLPLTNGGRETVPLPARGFAGKNAQLPLFGFTPAGWLVVVCEPPPHPARKHNKTAARTPAPRVPINSPPGTRSY